jgi:gliding motility-associated-like protein
MYKTRILVLILISQWQIVYSQGFELIGVVDSKFVIIDSVSGKATTYRNLQGVSNIADLTYHESIKLYYSLMNTSDSPSLVSLSIEGEYTEIGALTINGKQIQLAEALAYSTYLDKLYAAVSLNGGVSTNDFYSESVVEVNPLTGECFFVTEIATNHLNPEIDVMTFSGTKLYIADGAPPGADFLSIYQLDIQNAGSLSTPTLEYEGSYLPIRDFTATGLNIYFTEERNLYRYLQTSHTIELIGTTHNSNEYNGEIIHGISKLKSCELPVVNLGDDQAVCVGQTLLLDATNSNATYTWQDGSSNATFNVIESGTYYVEVENSCGLSTDSISIVYVNIPLVDLGVDQTICNTNSFVLNAGTSLGTYAWNDGSHSSTFEVLQSGTYWVEIENSCGTASDSIKVELNVSPQFDLGEDRTLCNANSFQLDATVPNGLYRWQDGSSNSTLEVYQSGTYWVEVENSCGLERDTIKLVFPEFDDLDIPNVFSPNGDGINETFTVDSRLVGSSLKVFHRTGKKVYESKNYQNNWTGNNLPAGVYYWSITDECDNNFKGWVQILY